MATILVVDDSPVIQRVLSVTLRRDAHTCITASSAAEALERLEDTGVDLVLLDLAMPDLDGLSLLRVLRADPRHESLPIVMLTASGQDQDRIDAADAGADDFLTKPASSAEVA